MIFLRVFKHLLPRARAWQITVDKVLRQFFEGLAGAGSDARDFFDGVWLDIFPQTTRELDSWDTEFGLRDTGLIEQERRDRLDAAWKALGGQSPRYVQDTLQGAGFDVYVHEWWEPASAPAPGVKQCVTPRSPLAVLRREFTGVVLFVECGEPLAECGEPDAEAGNGPSPAGYPLVNKIYETVPDLIIVCGEPLAECGEPEALCGNFTTFTEILRNYIVPLDPLKWPYFLYIGGSVYGSKAQIDPKRRDEFEALCLKICPTQQWLGIIVEYT